MSYLSIESVDTFYGEVQALYDVSIRVEKGEIVTLIGANGAGKSTMLRTISGLIRPRRGQILFDGKRIDTCQPDEIAHMGVIQAPEGRRIFPGLSVYENLELATTPWYRSRSGDHRRGFNELLGQVYELFPVLKQRSKQLGWSLSGGEQQMLAIGRALMAKPSVILLDEPSLGLAPTLVVEMFKTIQKINAQGTTILLVEQNAYMALKIANRGYCLENGRVVLADTAERLIHNKEVSAAYLGGYV